MITTHSNRPLDQYIYFKTHSEVFSELVHGSEKKADMQIVLAILLRKLASIESK